MKGVNDSRSPGSTFEILVATDIHLGFEEENPIRGDDSFNTFDEVLGIAKKRNVDFILLGGDLFHANKPSMASFHRCLSTLRMNCMGDKPIVVEFMSNQEEVFGHCAHPVVNYEDANLNIAIPVYSIHGNHDDPSGYKCMGSMDILAASGLINYFGKWSDYTQVKLSPLLLRKGETRLAIYGLSHIKDQRLARLFKEKRVEFKRPSEEPESWCNILVLHQNRVDRGPKNYIQESLIPDFFHLVIWGHEHECRINPEYNSERGFHVIQPGSPVATSLCDGEAAAKHVAVVKVNGLNARVEPIPLETVRPFIFSSLKLSETSFSNNKKAEKIENYVKESLEGLMERAKDLITGHPDQPTLPLIRLRVEYSEEEEYFNPIRLGQKYSGRVANPTDMILMKKVTGKRTKTEDTLDHNAMDQVVNDLEAPVDRESLGSRVEKVIDNYFKTADESKQMSVLSVKGMNEAISRVISKDDKEALLFIVEHQKKKTMEYLSVMDSLDETNINEKIMEFRNLRLSRPEEETKEMKRYLEDCVMRNETLQSRNSTIGGAGSDSDMDVTFEPSFSRSSTQVNTPTRGRGSRGPRGGARVSRATSRAASRAASKTASQTAIRGRGRGRGQASLISMLSSQASTESSPAKRRKVVYSSGSDDDDI